MQHLIYTGVQRLTSEKPAMTRVTLDVDGERTELGFVSRSKGEGTYTATLISGAAYSAAHSTKKQAGGALKKLHDGAKQTSGILVGATDDAPETAEETDPETDSETTPEVAEEIDPEQAKRAKRNARRRELRQLAKAA